MFHIKIIKSKILSLGPLLIELIQEVDIKIQLKKRLFNLNKINFLYDDNFTKSVF